MESDPKAHLRVVPPERRKNLRSTADPGDNLLCLDGSVVCPCKILSIDVGAFSLSLPQEVLRHEDGQVYDDLQIIKDDAVLVSGKWSLKSFRHEKNHCIANFELPLLNSINACRKYCASEIFLKTNRYRIFSLADHPDLEAISSHFTEVKDFAIRVPARIHINAKNVQTVFDFSADRKTLDVLDFSVETNDFPIFAKDMEVVVEYSFLGLKYIFASRVKSVDSDFGIASLEIPKFIIAISARRFDRYPCHVKATFLYLGREYRGSIDECSVSGCSLRGLPLESFEANSKVEILIGEGDIAIEGATTNQHGATWGLRFPSSDSNDLAIRRLLLMALPRSILARTAARYEDFIKLYEDVGYAPKEDFEHWQRHTFAAWSYQDAVLPGNCTGGEHDGTIVSSAGTLPFGRQVVYGHSFCMVKTAEAAGTLLTQAIYSSAIGELLPGVQYYSGSYALGSRFTTRMHVLFEIHAHPENQFVIYSQQLFPHKENKNRASNLLAVSPIATLDISHPNPTIQRVARLLCEPHPLFSDVHKVNNFMVSVGESRALVVESQSPVSFTAAGMFGFTWIFGIGTSCDLAAIAAELRGHPEFAQRPFQVVVDGGATVPDLVNLSDKKKPAFWTFTHKDDLGPLLGSMCRSFYSILKKYGEDGREELLRFL